MTTKVTLPQLGESVHEGTVGKWLKQVGDTIEEFEPIVEILTDKVNAEVPAPINGRLAAILVKEGETVEVGTVIAEMIPLGAAMPAPAPASVAPVAQANHSSPAVAPAASSGGADQVEASFPNGTASGGWYDEDEEDTFAGAVPATADNGKKKPNRYSPAVRRLAEEHNLDLTRLPVRGSGMGGRITRDDVLQYIEQQRRLQQPVPTRALPYAGEAAKAPAYTPPPPVTSMHDQMAANAAKHTENYPATVVVPTPPQPTAPVQTQQMAAAFAPAPTAPQPVVQPPVAQSQTPVLNGNDEFVPLTPMRRSIAEHMVRSVHTSPHAWTMVEVDMTKLVRYRAQNKEEFKRREGVDLTFMPFFMKAVTDGLRQFPTLNASWSPENNGIVLKRNINLGVAIDVPDGLVVPVVQQAEEKSLVGLARSLNDLVTRGRNRKLTMQDLQGGTFTVNNPGSFGSVMSQPIINQPQAAIVTMESIVKRPVVVTDPDGNDTVVVRSMMNMCISFDHRVVDGATAGRFLQFVKKWLETRDYNAGF